MLYAARLELAAPDLKAAFRQYCKELQVPDERIDVEWERFWALLGQYVTVTTRTQGDKVRL